MRRERKEGKKPWRSDIFGTLESNLGSILQESIRGKCVGTHLCLPGEGSWLLGHLCTSQEGRLYALTDGS